MNGQANEMCWYIQVLLTAWQWHVLERSWVNKIDMYSFCHVFTGWLCLFTRIDTENQNLSIPRTSGQSTPKVLNPVI